MHFQRRELTILSLPTAILLLLFSKTLHGAVPSPEASTSLICPTADEKECYPALFQPTKYFQRIRDGQSIPPGLHVRMNLATGLKEARLNVPEEGDVDENAIVVVDQPPSNDNEEEDKPPKLSARKHQGSSRPEEQIPIVADNGPKDLTVSEQRIQEKATWLQQQMSQASRHMHGDPGERDAFVESARTIQSGPASVESERYLSALDIMTDLVHSLQWGQMLASDATLSHHLVDLVAPSSTASVEIRSAAALLLATAIQNNQEALTALVSHFVSSDSPIDAVLAALQKSPVNGQEKFESRLVFLASQLCHSDDQLRLFLQGKGLDTALHIFSVSQGLEGVKLQGRIVNLVADHAAAVAKVDWAGLLQPWCTALTNVLNGNNGSHSDSAGGTPPTSVKEAAQVVQTLLEDAKVAGCMNCDCNLGIATEL